MQNKKWDTEATVVQVRVAPNHKILSHELQTDSGVRTSRHRVYMKKIFPEVENLGPRVGEVATVRDARFPIVCQSHKPCCGSLPTRLVVGNIATTSLVGR